jgi:protein gp37
MNKSKIEWCDMTWNPVTGCFHKCPYCYAEKIANRFGMLKNGVSLSETEEILKYIYGLDSGTDYEVKGECIELSTPIGCEINEPFPFNFRPTLYKYRLHEPERKKKPQRIFVCSMADLFGEWVPDEWIRSVADACRQASHHKYLFLTKNPAGYRFGMHTMFGNGFWLGTTINTQQDLSRHSLDIMNTPGNLFLSIEPIHGFHEDTERDIECWKQYYLWKATTEGK